MSPDSRPTDPLPPAFQIGDWRVHSDLNRVERDGESVQVEPRVMAVLVDLAEHAGEVRTRDEILAAVWGDVIVQEEALTHAISRLRGALGDDRRAPRFIETIPKRGYRLVAAVAAVAADGDDATSTNTTSGPRTIAGSRLWPLGMAAALVAVLTVRALSPPPPLTEPEPALLDGTPLTTLVGREMTPALAPDGTRVAFSREADGDTQFDLFVVQPRAEDPIALTETPGTEHGPAWSPDGTHIAYLHSAVGTRTSVRVLPALGGSPRTLAEAPSSGAIEGIDWHRSGEWLVLALRDSPEAPWGLHRLPLEGGRPTPLFAPVVETKGDSQPALSPDGDRVAFLRADTFGFSDIHVAALDGSELRRLTFGQGRVRGIDWTADGKALVFSSGTAFSGEFRLSSVDVETSKLSWLPTRGTRAVHPSIATGTGALVYVRETYDRHLMRLVTDADDSVAAPQPFARSSTSEYDGHHSPSGERVAFVSRRSGHPEVWICDSNGNGARRVTSFEGPHVEFLQWSHDERLLAYDVMDRTRSAIHVTDVEKQSTRLLTDSDTRTNQVMHSWSRDDRYVYFEALDGTRWSTKRADVGTGEVEELLPFRTHMLAESTNGDSLYYVKSGPPHLWRSDPDGSDESLVFDAEGGTMTCYWRVVPDGLLYFRKTGTGTRLSRWSAANDEASDVLTLPIRAPGIVDVATDGRSVLYDQVSRVEADLILVESPR